MQVEPSVRISPSGLVAGDQNPLASYGGAVFGGQALNNAATASTITSIGPANAPSTEAVLTRTSGPPGPNAPDANLVAIDSDFNAFVIDSPGKYLFDAQVCIGFDTSDQPTAAGNVGGLRGFIDVIGDDDTIISTVGLSPFAPSAIAKTYNPQSSQSVKMFGTVNITAQMLETNEAPIRGLSLRLQRVSNSGSGLEYNNDSGILRIRADTNLFVRRVR